MKKEGIIGYPTDPHKKSGPFPDGFRKCDGDGSVPDHHTIHTGKSIIKPESDGEPSSGIVKNWNNLAEKN